MNYAVSLGLYAAFQKEMGEPLYYPGNTTSWDMMSEGSSVDNDAAFEVWAMTNPEVGNQAYNITDGANVRNCDIWAKTAE